jgi:hypothetical protein
VIRCRRKSSSAKLQSCPSTRIAKDVGNQSPTRAREPLSLAGCQAMPIRTRLPLPTSDYGLPPARLPTPYSSAKGKNASHISASCVAAELTPQVGEDALSACVPKSMCVCMCEGGGGGGWHSFWLQGQLVPALCVAQAGRGAIPHQAGQHAAIPKWNFYQQGAENRPLSVGTGIVFFLVGRRRSTGSNRGPLMGQIQSRSSAETVCMNYA